MIPLVMIITIEILAVLKLGKTVAHARLQSPTRLWLNSLGLIFFILGLPVYLVFLRHW